MTGRRWASGERLTRQDAPSSFRIPHAALPTAIGVFLIGGLGPNIGLAFIAVLVLLVASTLLWRPGEPPILLFTFAYPWIQASVSIFHSNWLGITVADYAPFSGDMQTAILLSLFGILILAIGMRLGAGSSHSQDARNARALALSQAIEKWFWLYAVSAAVSFAALAFAWTVPALSQPMLALAGLKWAFFFMLAYASFVRRARARFLFAIAFLGELALGVGGYFSDFKSVFFITIFAGFASGVRFTMRSLIMVSVLCAILLGFGIVWTAVKGQYRSFISGGEATQIVTVDYMTRMQKLSELVLGLDAQTLDESTEKLFRRVTYVEYFASVLNYVPSRVPHENGAILWDAVSRPFMPRMFFPDKAAIDDTARTNLYTGGLVGNSEATSISLGYVAECYIDFGQFGMMIALLIIGLIYGALYRWFLRWKASPSLLGMAVATAVILPVGPLENSFTKVFGSLIIALLVAAALVTLIIPRWAPWLLVAQRR
ncbi:hypothetical protein HYPP_02279 [Hyphomicrobium sp. ghe19]|nr:hypothetical protein HYPP_02279 [Hyphomicrobium sp. ghe19]